VDAITTVSIQTNMLAVKGSVEAARAGEFGKGFAVVSTDIRNLARDSAENAERIKDTVREVQAESKASQQAVLDEDHLVSFADQEYAFPIERVEEIIQLPSQITQLPNSHGHVLGVIMLRNRLLPLVSLRNMFGLPPVEMSDSNKVVVISLGEGVSVGVVMDGVKGPACRAQYRRSHARPVVSGAGHERHPGHLPAAGRQASGLGPFGRTHVQGRGHAQGRGRS
jgi:hypothetical protein